MKSKVFYYARVSSKDQNLDRQLDAFRKMNADEHDIVTDKESGKDTNRTGYLSLKNTMLREGDVLVVKSLDRLSRNKEDIKTELQYFKDHKIRLKVLDLPTTLMEVPEGQEWVFEMVNNILIEVIGTIAEQERTTIRQRQREGIESARLKGKHLGRPKIIRPENWDDIIEKWKKKEIHTKDAIAILGLKRSSFYKLIKADE